MNLPTKFRQLIVIPFIILLLTLAALFLRPGQLTAASGMGGTYQDDADGSDEPVTPDQIPDSTNGLAIHAERCSNCHGPFGLGDGELAADLPNPPASHASKEFLRSAVPADLFLTVTQGRIDKGMPPFGPTSSNPLSEDQRWNVIAAIYSLGTPVESIERGQEIFGEQCASCHGTEGQGNGPGAADFEGSSLDISSAYYWSNNSNQMVFEQLIESDLDGAHEFELTDDELWPAIDFIRTFSYLHVDALASLSPIEEGTISGQVRNGSTDEILNVRAAATLRGFTPELQLSVILSDTVGTDGKFEFNVADAPPDLFYRVSVDYEGIDFSSDFGQLAVDNPELELPITVFEKTTDPDVIAIDQLHVILDFGQGFVNVSEFYVASNDEAAVFVGETGQASDGTFQMTLPAGAQNPIFQRGFGSVDSFIPASEVMATGNGWADTFPIRPGTGTVNLLVQYALPYEEEASFSHTLHYPTSAVNLVIPDAGVSLITDGEWTDTGQQVMGTSAVATYGQIALPANDELTISLEGKPQTAAPTPANLINDNSTEILVGAALAIAVIVIAAVVLRQWRMTPAFATDRQSLIEEIAILDEAFESGEISQEDYQREREELKTELMAVWGDENNSGEFS